MISIRQLFSVAVITIALSYSAFAGDLWIPGVVNPPPPPEGRVVNCPTRAEAGELDILTETAIIVCQRMLFLF